MSNLETVRDIYRRFGQGDIPGMLARFHADAEWRLAESHPYSPDGAAWVGPEAIARKFFMRAGRDWDGFTLTPERWHDAGETVVLECRYGGIYRPTGKRLDAQACHVWAVRDGKIARFQQFIDTAQLRDVMGAARAAPAGAPSRGPAERQAALPPSTMRTAPVTKDASSPARNRIA